MGTLFQQFPLTSLKLFDTLVRPILLYASDFWGILKLPKNNPIENIQHYVLQTSVRGTKANNKHCSALRTRPNTS